MTLIGRPKPKPAFIKKPMFDSRESTLYDLYNLTYYPPISLTELNAKNIVSISPSLYKLAVNIVKNLGYQLYQIPAVRKFYGKDFVHGFTARYDPSTNALVFDNLDDTPEAMQYCKEITACLAIVINDFLEQYNCYIFYQGDMIQFITDTQLKQIRKAKIEKRIVWVE